MLVDRWYCDSYSKDDSDIDRDSDTMHIEVTTMRPTIIYLIRTIDTIRYDCWYYLTVLHCTDMSEEHPLSQGGMR